MFVCAPFEAFPSTVPAHCELPVPLDLDVSVVSDRATINSAPGYVGPASPRSKRLFFTLQS